jgi:hypothetical protein
MTRKSETPYVVVGLRGNVWSDQAEEVLIEADVQFRFERISTPPHPRPETIPGADPMIRMIPTLLLDYYVKDSSGDDHNIRVELASGVDEVKQWVKLEGDFRDLERGRRV